VNLLIGAVSQIDILQLRILRERDVPNCAVAQGIRGDKDFFHEGPIWFENLNTIVDAIANVEQSVFGKVGALCRIAKLLGGRFPGLGNGGVAGWAKRYEKMMSPKKGGSPCFPAKGMLE
jgi:hypothetical protein